MFELTKRFGIWLKEFIADAALVVFGALFIIIELIPDSFLLIAASYGIYCYFK